MIRLFRDIYLTNRFFYLFGGIVVLFACSFAFDALFPVAELVLMLAIAIVVVNILVLFHPKVIVTGKRKTPNLLSLGSENTIRLMIRNRSNIPLQITVIDELPSQLQQRDFSLQLKMTALEKKQITYPIIPNVRGEYVFGNINIFAQSFLGLVERRYKQEDQSMKVAVYPSVLLMKKFELKMFSQTSISQGIKKMRRLGHSYEFEQIKNYVRGDDYRSINWKATSRRAELMVNQFEDEKSQQVYNVIDLGRTMRMPFNGLSLLDHAINSSLVISNIILHKEDKAGLITFSEKPGTVLKAERSRIQLRKILDALYKQKEGVAEANYELLYQLVKNRVKNRSLLFLFTNFESYYALERVLPILRRLNSQHLLVVIFFKNTEITDFIDKEPQTILDIYDQTIAEKFTTEKEQIVHELWRYGIQSILTRPEDLSIDVINKYLEIKSRGML